MFLNKNSFNISFLVKEPSTIPSDHSFNQSPHDFLPTITPVTIFGCLVNIVLFPYLPFSYCLIVSLPLGPLISNLTSTPSPPKFNRPCLYDCKKKEKIRLKPSEYFFCFLSVLPTIMRPAS